MNVQEMHIGVDLELQQVNSSVVMAQKPEELDFLLNQEVYRYINSRTRKLSDEKGIGFQGDIKRYEDLKGVLTYKTLPVYVNDTRSVFSYIPSDCYRLIKDRSYTKDLCGTAYAPATTTPGIYYAVLDIYKSSFGSDTFQYFKLKLGGNVIFDIANYPQYTGGLTDLELKFELIDFLLEAIRVAGFEAKYESALGMFSSHTLYVYRETTFNLEYSTASVASYTTIAATLLSTTKLSSISDAEEVDNDLLPTDKYSFRLNSAHGTTTPSCPISILRDDKLIVFHKQKFIVTSVTLDYVRIPKKISLPLNQTCDLDPSVHPEIVSNLAKRLAGITNAQQYQQLLRENITKE